MEILWRSLCAAKPRRHSLNGRHAPFIRQVASMAAEDAPLAGVKVLDFTSGQAGPLTTMLLGDLGADIVKVENPRMGDISRQWGLKKQAERGKQPESLFFLAFNRNKRSVTLDLESGADRARVDEMLENFDVLVTDWTPDYAAKLRLDHNRVMANHQRLIYCSVTGYGLNGPFRNRKGREGVLNAETGLTNCTGEPDREPVRPQCSPTDHATAYYSYSAVMAALLATQSSGKGVLIDVAGFDAQLAAMGNVGSAYLNACMEYVRVGTAHPTVVPYQVFATSDGNLMIGTGNDTQFSKFAAAADSPELAQDPRFCKNSLRVANRKELVPIVEEIIRRKTTREWNERFRGKGFPFGAVNNMEQVFAHTQSQSRGLVAECEHATLGRIRTVSPPVLFDGSRMPIRFPPPTLGQHNEEIFAEINQ